MHNTSDDQFVIIQSKIDANRQEYDEKTKNHASKLDNIIATM